MNNEKHKYEIKHTSPHHKSVKKRKTKLKNIIILLIGLISLITLIYSIINIVNWEDDNVEIKKQLQEIDEIIQVEIVEESTNNENIEIIEQKNEIKKDNPYWDYIKMNLINVDFTELKKKNKDTAGWIQVNGTNINYPFVQTKNNDYYLTHSFDKSYNQAGWVFLDYRNNKKLSDKNNIIYAHSRLNNTMFGTLKKTLESNWQNNTNNHIVKISTESENSLWQVFSVYHIEETSDYIKTSFKDNQEFLTLTKKLIDRSVYNFNTEVNENDIILTLSTCYGKTERMVLHAKLIKKEIK